MAGSYLASIIDKEYRREQFYQNRKSRQKCKDKSCTECKFQQICTSYEGSERNEKVD